MFRTKQKSHQNSTSDGFQIKLLASYLTAINPKRYAVKSQLLSKLVGWIK